MQDTYGDVLALPDPELTAAKLKSRNPVLFWTTVASSLLFVGALVGIAADPRTVAGGEAVWFKPMRYAMAMALFTGTLAWLTPHFTLSERVLRATSWAVSGGVLFELTAIAGQAARGVDAHFNHTTGFDRLVYLLMGVVIASMTLLVAALFVAGTWTGFDVHPAFSLGITLGGLLFVVGSFEGGAMSALTTHTVGGGYTLPVVGWTLVGDFRVAHFVGLHSLQVLPLAGYLSAVGARRERIDRPRLLVWLVGFAYAGLLAGALALAVYPLYA
ncbi:hypothetical protein EGH22_17275 [Halomicroarcula sp. F28]|uniref:hypothetical protein n=1 Tax=Haloarcula salinisoli TaxID=2487746 RepID=UPI001C72CD6B|nr:hypothetical protein [Halomicroarcula salinisoli]MBX0288086.1 hypothetical protein [Halomicroarcula salinisoli]